jgi:hypothetical protein
VLFLFILGERTGSLLEFISISLLLIFIPDFHVRYSRTPPFYWERTVSVCIVTLSFVFVLCVFFHPIRLEGSIFGGSYIFGGPYIFGVPYLFGGLYLFGGIFRSSKAHWIILTLRYQLRQKWRH